MLLQCFRGYPYTTVPRSSVLTTPYASHARMPGAPGRAHGQAHRRSSGVQSDDAGVNRRTRLDLGGADAPGVRQLMF